LELSGAINTLARHLEQKRTELLALSGILNEYKPQQRMKQMGGPPRDHRINGASRRFLNRGRFMYKSLPKSEDDFQNEASACLDELIGALAEAAMLRAHFSDSKGVIAGELRQAIAHPRRVHILRLSVRTRIAAKYQRANEPPGTYWWDIFVRSGRLNRVRVCYPVAEKISEAAKLALAEYQEETKHRRKLNPFTKSSDELADRLRRWLIWFGKKPKAGMEDPRDSTAIELLDLVLEPLNVLIMKHGGHMYKREPLLKAICKKSQD
jgi:hypothetical protein